MAERQIKIMRLLLKLEDRNANESNDDSSEIPRIDSKEDLEILESKLENENERKDIVSSFLIPFLLLHVSFILYHAFKNYVKFTFEIFKVNSTVDF